MIYLNLFTMFFKIGLFGFGGGLAMLPLIYETAKSIGGMGEDTFANLVGIAQVTPGPIAVNAATFVGFNLLGLPGALCATLGVALPSFILVTIVSSFLKKFKESKLVQGAFVGIRPATVGLMAAASIIVARGSIYPEGSINYFACAMCLAAIILMAKTKISPIWMVLGSGVLGAILYGVIL